MAKSEGDSGEVGKAASTTPSTATPMQSHTDFPIEEVEQYSIFTKNQKRGIVLLVAFAAVFSPLSSFIYYPARNALSKDLNVSLNKIDLTITSYMVVSGVAPSLVGGIADKLGRRPVYLVIFTIYVLANVGLAFQHSYPALLVLRMIQSAGSSGTISIGYGVVADIANPAERGSPNIAPSLGPVLGGIIVQEASWRWIFGFLVIISLICLICMSLTLPETSRSIAGDGSLRCRSWHIPPLNLLLKKSQTKLVEMGTEASPKPRTHIPNPFKSLRLLFYLDTAPVILINSITYTTYCCLQASLSSLFIQIYGYTELEAGLIYIPFGLGCLVSSYLSGRLMTFDYRRTAAKNGIEVDTIGKTDRTDFPIEIARFRSMPLILLVSTAAMCGYGWVLQAAVHVSIPLILQFILGSLTTIIFNLCGTLLIDLHPTQPATAQASLNLIRCSMSAAWLAALQPLIDRVGVGWCYSIFAVVFASCGPLCLVVLRWGGGWRRGRMEGEHNRRGEGEGEREEEKAGG